MKRIATAIALISMAGVAPAFADGGYDAFTAATGKGTDAMSTQSAQPVFERVENSSVPRLKPVDAKDFSNEAQGLPGIVPAEIK